MHKRVISLESTSKECTCTTQSQLMATARPFVPKETNPTEKPEEERLCPSMWGKKECKSRAQCKRVHLTLCPSANCYMNDETRKGCTQWHGHMRAAVRREKAKERLEAEKRQFAAWKKQSSGNGVKGHRGAPHHQNKPQKQRKRKEGLGLKHLQRQEPRPKSKPRNLKLGDYIPAPPPAVPAWGPTWRPPTVPQATAPNGQAGTVELRQQIHDMLQMLLRSGVF